MTLRFRLTLVSTIVLMVVLTLFGAGVYILLNKTLHDNLDSDIARFTAELGNALDRSPIGIVRGRLDFIAVYVSPDGEPQVVSPFAYVGDSPLPTDERVRRIARGDSNTPYYEDIEIRGLELRLLVVRMNGRDLKGALMVAASRANITETLRRLRLLLTWAGIGGLVFAAALAWQAARTALRPVEDVAEAASQIGATGNLSRRVDPGGEDELGRLAKAFNGMLDRLEAAHEELERTVEGQRRFLADASHELRTPLTTMRGNLEVIRSSPDISQRDLRDALEDSIEEAERMSRLVEDLLALARADARAPRPEEPVRLAAVTREAVALATSADEVVGGDGPEVDVIADDSVVVRGSPDLLRRLVTNLVENAIKYTPADGRIDVRVARDNGWAMLRVADTGIGMSEEELAHAFDRFWRSDRSRGERGSGLGLAIAKSVAEEHGGAIVAESVPGRGTVMTVRLPSADQGETARGTEPAPADSGSM